MTNSTYTPLHVHSLYSSLDGMSKVKDIVSRCKEVGAHGACITDHAFATSHYLLSEECNKQGIKPIFAVEGYLSPFENTIKSKIENFKNYYHITMIAKNEIGYKNLMILIADSFMNGKYVKPRTSMNQLERYKEGVIILTACLGGYPSQMLSLGRDEEAYTWTRNMKEIFGKENFFVELTNTNLDIQFEVNRKLVKMAEDLDLDVIITPDSHYSRVEDSDFHRAMVCININRPFVPTGKTKEGDDVDEGSMFYTPGEYFLKSREDLEKYYLEFEKMDEYFENTNKIADSIEWIKLNKDKKFPCDFKDPNSELINRVFDSLNSKINSGILSIENVEVYKNRLKEELDTIIKMGFSDYFIEIQNIVKWSNENGITTGPGRGCFEEDTLIPVFEQGFKKIKEIVPGDLVYSSDLTVQKVIANLSYTTSERLHCIDYKGQNNLIHRIFATKDHKFLVVAKNSIPTYTPFYEYEMTPFFLELEKINELDHSLVGLFNTSKARRLSKVPIINTYVCTCEKEKLVYDLMVEGNQTYMVGNSFVHNSGAGSFINFLLGITKINPLDYDLLFSRMLNSGRSAYPQIGDILDD